MFGHTRISVSIFLLLLTLALGRCSSKGQGEATTVTPAVADVTDSSNVYRCVAEATPPTINGSTQNPPRFDETTNVRVVVSNSSGRNAIPRRDSAGTLLGYYVSEFATTTTLSGGYYNNTNAKQTRGATIEVIDLGTKQVAKCAFTVLVNPSSYNPYPNSPYPANNFPACRILGSDTPATGENLTYTISAINPPSGLTFSTLDLDSTTKFTVTQSGNSGTATVTFPSPGYHKLSNSILSSSAAVGYCEKIVYVRPKPVLFLTASSTVSQPGHLPANQITLTANPLYFAATPIVTFTSDKPEVIITQTGNTATVTSAIAQNVRITATAVNGSDSVSSFKDLVFGTPDPNALNCRLTHAVQSDGKTVRYQLSTVGVAQNLTVTQFQITDGDNGVITSNQGQTVDVRYESPGFKTISVSANLEGDSSKLCNAGNPAFDSVIIGNDIGCSAFISPNPSSIYSKVIVTAIPYGLALGTYRIKSVSSSSTSMTQNSNLPSGLDRELFFNAAGDFSVDVVIEDTTTLATATCSTRQVVSSYIPQCLATIHYADQTQVTSPRIREDLYIKVTSNLYQGWIDFNPGAQVYTAPGLDYVTFPATSVVATSYKNIGFVSANVLVRAPSSNYTTMCSLPINVLAGLECQVNTTARKTIAHTTAITNLSTTSYPAGTTNVAHSLTTSNSKGTVNFNLSGDGFNAVSSSSATISYATHGKYNLQGFVTDSKDWRGAYCTGATTLDKEERVTIVKAAGTYNSALDTAKITLNNTSGQPVRVMLIAKNGTEILENPINVPASGSVISLTFNRDTASGLFDFTLKVSGDEPRTGTSLVPTVNATINGVARNFNLGAL